MLQVEQLLFYSTWSCHIGGLQLDRATTRAAAGAGVGAEAEAPEEALQQGSTAVPSVKANRLESQSVKATMLEPLIVRAKLTLCRLLKDPQLAAADAAVSLGPISGRLTHQQTLELQQALEQLAGQPAAPAQASSNDTTEGAGKGSAVQVSSRSCLSEIQL